MEIYKKYNMILVMMIVLPVCAYISSCSSIAGNPKDLVITEAGLPGLIEVGMTIKEFYGKDIGCSKNSSPYRRPGQQVYKAEGLGVEFETRDDIVIRIWFFADKNDAFHMVMPKEHTVWALNSITGNDIVRNFGPVAKYENRNPPKGRNEAMWLKYRPFGIENNTITYPGCPFHFGLNWDDTLSYITVSKVDAQ